MIQRTRHLRDDRLFECYTSRRANDLLDPRTAEHLADCASCAARYAELATFMDELSTQADVETDAVFTPERLRAQQEHIARRIEHVGRPARVISFPRRLAGDRLRPTSPSQVRARWIAAAAAAGLFAGVGLGVTFELTRHAQRTDTVLASNHSAAPPRALPEVPVATDGTTPSDVAADDAFLSDLDVVGERPQTRELMLIDTLTPHVREIRNAR